MNDSKQFSGIKKLPALLRGGTFPHPSPQPTPSFTLVAPSIGHGFLGLGFFLGVKWVSDTLMFLGFHETLNTVSLPVITPLSTPP